MTNICDNVRDHRLSGERQRAGKGCGNGEPCLDTHDAALRSPGVAAGGGEAGGVACRVVVVDEAEIKLGLGVKREPGERGEIGVVAAVRRCRQVEIADRARDPRADRVGLLGPSAFAPGMALLPHLEGLCQAGAWYDGSPSTATAKEI
jgi:hypothetical protein